MKKIKKENQKTKKAPFVIYPDLECLLEKTNDDENKQTTTVNKHTYSGYSTDTLNVHLMIIKIY